MTTAIATSAGPPAMSNHHQPGLAEKVHMSNGHQPHLAEKDYASGLTSSSEKHHPPTISTTTEKPRAQSPITPHTPAAYSQPHAGPSKPTSPTQRPHLLSSHLLAHPEHTVKRAMSTQFPLPNPIMRLLKRFNVKHSVIKGMTAAEWKKFEKMGPELRRKAGWKTAGSEGQGVEVSDLFWKMYMSLLPTLERDPLSGLVPPDLLGSTTTMPLTVISLIPDIMQHYHDVIIRAREEVFLATNYWQPSNSVSTITGSLIELSRLIMKEGRKKVVVKIMYDRGSLEQIYNSHAMVPEEKWKPLDLPGPEDIPGLELEVINFHRVLLGTFHAKFLIVDRKLALINSNNIQDRPNLELMSHLEGPIVDSFYEIALHSWYNRLSPMLPCMSKPYQPPSPGYLFSDSNPFLDDIEVLKAAKAARLLLRQQTKDQDAETARLREEEGIPASDRLRDAVKRVVDHQRQNLADWRPAERFDESVQRGMHELREMKERWTGVAPGSRSRPGSRGPSRRGSANEGMFRSLLKGDKSENNSHTAPDPSEAPSSPTIAETPVKSKTYPQPGHIDDDHDEDVEVSSPKARANHVAFAPLVTDSTAKPIPTKLAVPEPKYGDAITSSPTTSLRLPTPIPPPTSPASALVNTHGHPLHHPTPVNTTGENLPPSAMTQAELQQAGLDVHAGLTTEHMILVDDEDRVTIDDQAEGDLGAIESVVPEGMGSKRLYKMSKMFNAAGVLSEAWATVEDSDELDTFQPHVIHKPHKPVPVAMCCRKPHGFPGHHDIRNPQNAAWLAGFRYAKKKVFVQTPTLNARPIVRAIKQACRRDVQVELLLDLGFNDKGESIPFQGGTNEEVVVRLYKALRKVQKEHNLKVYWYTGKDQVRPLNAVKKQRNCHIKFAAYDDEVLIIGNGNQDSQSWFHSQEVNIMVDSKQIVKEMMDTLLTNQNTIQYGLVDTDGIWRDKEGKTLQDYGATEGGRFKGLSGFIAFAKTI